MSKKTNDQLSEELRRATIQIAQLKAEIAEQTQNEEKSRQGKGTNNASSLPGNGINFSNIDRLLEGGTSLTQTELELLFIESQRSGNIGSWVWNLGSGASVWSKQLFEIYGRDPSLGVPNMDSYLDSYHPDDIVPLLDAMEKTVTHHVPYEVEYRIFREDNGEERWIHSHGRLRKDESGCVQALLGISMDVTDRKRIEQALQSEKLLSEEYINSLPGLFYVFDEERLVRWNHEWRRVMGYSDEELALKRGPDFFEGEDKKKIEQKMQTVFLEGSAVAEAEVVTKDGEKISYYFTGTRKRLNGKNHLIGLGIDISDRKSAEEERLSLERQVQQSQKLESLGVLAGGIAHDFNNLLMGILGNAEVALSILPPESSIKGYLQDIDKAAHRAADLAKQMLDYSGKGHYVIERVRIETLIEEMIQLLGSSLSNKIVLELNFASNASPVEADPTQLRQVIMNIIMNAYEAIGEKQGEVSICTGTMKCDRDYLHETNVDIELEEGLYSYFEVTDSGSGMDKETQSKIFDPFFSTKFTGRGLGLAAVAGIVRGHKGVIKVLSNRGDGTCFRVLLPVNEGPLSLSNHPPVLELESSLAGRTVLLVDDDEVVRHVGNEILSLMGIAVVCAKDGREAIELFQEQPNAFDCVLIDYTMPRLDGVETFKELRMVRDDVPVILSSGYSEKNLSSRFVDMGFSAFIQKPYRIATLKETLLAVLTDSK